MEVNVAVLTVSVVGDDVTPPIAAVMSAVPAATPVASPVLGSTFAIVGALEFHAANFVTSCVVPSE